MKRTRLKPISDKRLAENVDYRLKVCEWKLKRECQDGFLRCQFENGEGRCCEYAMDAPHHRKGRGKWLTDRRYFMALCFKHHRFVEDNKRWSRKHGYIIYK